MGPYAQVRCSGKQQCGDGPAWLADPLVYFGGFKEHVGFYPPVRDAAVKQAAKAYANAKGNLQFRYDAPIPYALITAIVQARVRENQARISAKRKATSAK